MVMDRCPVPSDDFRGKKRVWGGGKSKKKASGKKDTGGRVLSSVWGGTRNLGSGFRRTRHQRKKRCKAAEFEEKKDVSWRVEMVKGDR